MDLHKTDPEFAERFEYFAFQEVPNEEGRQLPEKIRYMAILAVLIGCGGADAYREMLPKALDGGVTPVMIKEIVYQAVDYLGYGRMLPFLSWIAENCFGDYYTRKGLTLSERELITFCFLAAQGGCEPQLTAHAKGNMNMGNDKAFLLSVVSQCLPYIGYPRSLNAITCINKAVEE